MDTLKKALLCLTAAAIPITGYGLSLPLRIKHERVSFTDLPAHLSSLKILHISDFHARYTTKTHINIWQAISNLNFDIAVITGDIILGDYLQLKPHINGLRDLAENVPVYFVDGNHDYMCYRKIVKLFNKIGITTLANNISDCKLGTDYGNKSLSVAGFRDFYYLQSKGFKGVAPLMDKMAAVGGFHLILSHQPQIFYSLRSGDMPFSALVLAGHTHGGQVRLPFLPTLLAPGQGVLPEYGDGWYKRNDGKIKMYISRGIGATHFPLRFFNPPEIAVIELIQPHNKILTQHI